LLPFLCVPQVYGVVFNQFMPQGASMFVTYGVKHIKFWISAVDEVRLV
jgi:hypothetical protein